MNKKIFTVGIPCIFFGIFIVVVLGIYSLNNMDKAMAEENAKAAIVKVYHDFVDEEVDVTKFLNLYRNDKFSHEGSFDFSELELLDNSYAALLKDIPVEYSIVRSPQQHITSVAINLKGDGHVGLSGYVNDDYITFKIDEFYDGYFKLPNSNIKETYNESLWFSLLGDMMSSLPDQFALDLYPQIEIKDYVISDFLKKYNDKGTLIKVLDGVSAEKTAVQKDFFVDNTYIAANEYVVTVSKAAMKELTEIVTDYFKIEEAAAWKPAKTDFLAYISANNRLMGVKFNFAISYADIPYDTEVLISFLGDDNVFEKTSIDITLKGQDNSIYSLKVLVTNKVENNKQDATLIIAMNQPYISRLCELKFNRDIMTNEVSINSAMNIPGLKGNINYTGKIYDDEIIEPKEVYNIYELNLWQILNIYSSTDWSFIK